jgi:hypothetical protein
MNRKQLRFIAYYLIFGVISALTLNITACSSAKTTTTVSGPPRLTSIAVTPNPPDSLAENFTQQFTAIGAYSNGTTMNISSQVSWVSDNTKAATIDKSGLATGVAAGIANITATLDGVTSPPQTLVVESYY